MNKSTKYWFKRRRYGYGWTPATYEGWLILGIYLVIVAIATTAVNTSPNRTAGDEAIFLVGILAATLCLVGTAITKGPQPKWRWGKKDSDNPDEDF